MSRNSAGSGLSVAYSFPTAAEYPLVQSPVHWSLLWFVPVLDYSHFCGLEVLAVILSCLVLVGFWTRLSLLLLALYYSYRLLVSQLLYHHHVFCLALVLWVLLLSPRSRVWSLDRWIWPDRVNCQGTDWGCQFLRCLVSTIYFQSACSKLHSDWLSGKFLLCLAENQLFWTPFDEWLRQIPLAWLAKATVGCEFALAIGLWIVPHLAIPLGLALHLGIALTMSVETYSLQMICLYAVFWRFSEDWSRRVLMLCSPVFISMALVSGVGRLSRNAQLLAPLSVSDVSTTNLERNLLLALNGEKRFESDYLPRVGHLYLSWFANGVRLGERRWEGQSCAKALGQLAGHKGLPRASSCYLSLGFPQNALDLKRPGAFPRFGGIEIREPSGIRTFRYTEQLFSETTVLEWLKDQGRLRSRLGRYYSFVDVEVFAVRRAGSFVGLAPYTAPNMAATLKSKLSKLLLSPSEVGKLSERDLSFCLWALLNLDVEADLAAKIALDHASRLSIGKPRSHSEAVLWLALQTTAARRYQALRRLEPRLRQRLASSFDESQDLRGGYGAAIARICPGKFKRPEPTSQSLLSTAWTVLAEGPNSSSAARLCSDCLKINGCKGLTASELATCALALSQMERLPQDRQAAMQALLSEIAQLSWEGQLSQFLSASLDIEVEERFFTSRYNCDTSLLNDVSALVVFQLCQAVSAPAARFR